MKILVFCAFVAALFSVSAEELSREVFNDGSSIAIIAPLGVLPSGGFAAIRVEMENKGSKDLTWGLNVIAEGSSNQYVFRRGAESKISTEFGVSCPAGESRHVELLAPIQQRREGGINYRSVTITGSSPSYPDRRLYASFDKEAPDQRACLAYSKGLSQSLENMFQSAVPRGGPTPGSTTFAGELAIEKLPQDWRAYAGFDALFLSLEESKKLSPGVSNALNQWVLGGGRVIILNPGDDAIPESNHKLGFGTQEVINAGFDYSSFNLKSFGFV